MELTSTLHRCMVKGAPASGSCLGSTRTQQTETMNATWIQFKDGTLALLDDKELSIYDRDEGGCFISARRTERRADGGHRVFACDEQGTHLSDDELPQDIADTWPVGYSWRPPEEAEPLSYPS